VTKLGAREIQGLDLLDLPYPDDAFDVVIAEAVTMFVERERAAEEFARVTKPGGRVLATEFYAETGPFEMMTARGFLSDEGMIRSMAIMGRVEAPPANARKMIWLMPRMAKAVPYLGYIAVAASKPR
jgi:ubiquinone/menaquinone biosynthesis C-methylase UbiE